MTYHPLRYANARAAILAGLVCLAPTVQPVQAAAPDHMHIRVTEADAEGGLGTIGSYTYDPASDTYWTVLFGSGLGVRKIDTSGADTYIPPSILERFTRASDVPGGVTDADFSGTSLSSGILLNPAPVTIDYGNELDANNQPIGQVTYQPGELAYITDGLSRVSDGSGNYRFDLTKRVYTYDLRKVGTTNAGGVGTPDRNNAQDGVGGIMGAYNQVDWNDVYHVLATEEDLRDVAGYSQTASSGSNFGRQAAFATDGQNLYTVDSGTNTGGIFKINASTGAVSRLHEETGSGNIISEPAVLHTNVRQLGTGTGDQVLFDGTGANGNDGAILYVLDDGTPGVKTPEVAVSASFITSITDTQADVRSIATDSAGNIYYWDSGADGLFKYDTHGRLAALVNTVQLTAFNAEQDGDHRDSGGMLRLQVVEQAGQTTVLYRGDNSFVAGVDVKTIGDFNNDAAIDAQDTQFFIQQFNAAAPAPAAAADYLNYAKADLNSRGEVVGSSGGYDGTITNDAVDNSDLRTLRQFINLKPGDTDWDFDIDIADFATLKNNFNPVATDASFFEGNFDYETDGDVDIADFAALKANFNPAKYESDPLAVANASFGVLGLPAELAELILEIDEQGFAELVGNNITFDSIQIVADALSLLEGNYIPVGLGNPVTGDSYIADFTLGAGINLDGRIALGQIYDASLDLRDVVFTYNGNVNGQVNYIPEPATFALLALTFSATQLRRRSA